MVTRTDLKKWIIDGLAAHGGQATIPTIAKHIWDNHESELRQSGDLFYTWQYAMRWAGQNLQKEGKLSKKGSKRQWILL
ncbi:hypothetical protein ACR9YC_00690 [Parasphingorhabdus sp. DH2-15]|uniref:hypothetical protein n=1 Tax=Parasphingorhabdus sp. DH2-15 TaxID=3444112 RepID=UPI003F6825C7